MKIIQATDVERSYLGVSCSLLFFVDHCCDGVKQQSLTPPLSWILEP
jgi:hypothetical protein